MTLRRKAAVAPRGGALRPRVPARRTPDVLKDLDPELRLLVGAARDCRERAHAPYSAFRVGAALLVEGDAIFVGCNVENASYGATVCAERVAIGTMVAAGLRRLSAVAVYTEADPPALPCGICRQVLWEFGAAGAPGGGAVRVVAASPRAVRVLTLAELLPEAFSLGR